MVETKLRSDQPSSMGERIRKRLANSGAGAKPNETVQTGSGDRRTFHNLHQAGHHVDPKTMPPKDAGR